MKSPLFSDYPLRGFASDVTLSGNPRLTLLALKEALLSIGLDAADVDSRCERWRRRNLAQRKSWQQKTEAIQNSHPMDMGWVSACIGRRLDDRTIVINEYDLDPTRTCFTQPGTYFRHSPSASLEYEKICQAAGGYGERVTNAADLPEAIDRALEVIESENRQALLNVICR